MLYLLGALFLFFVSGILFTIYDSADFSNPNFEKLDLSQSDILILGIVLFVFSIGIYYVSSSLLKGKSWARVVVGVFSVLFFISAVTNLLKGSLASGLFSVLVHGTIVWYLFVYEESKKFFN